MSRSQEEMVDIGLQVGEAHPLFPYFLEKHLTIPISPFFLLVDGFSVTSNNNN